MKRRTRRNKYHNQHVKRGEHTFDSKAEAARYARLRSYQESGQITDLQVHPTFELFPAFTDRTGKRQPGIIYEADFSYIQDGLLIVEDVKGTLTEAFKLKQKLFLARYPDIELRLIKVK